MQSSNIEKLNGMHLVLLTGCSLVTTMLMGSCQSLKFVPAGSMYN